MENTVQSEDELIELQGFIKFYKYEDTVSGYKIASFKIDDNKQERTVTIVGYFPHYSSQQEITIKALCVTHPRYGIQFDVKEIYENLPTSKENIIHFLSSSQFKGIGKKAATAICDYIKEDTISTLINNVEIYNYLIENRIITEAQKNSLIEGLKKYDFKSSAYQVLLKNGFSLKNIMKAEAVYNEELSKVIETNPYQLAIDIDSIGFKSIDKLALNMGIKEEDERRVKAAILYTLLNVCHATGDTYLYLKILYENVLKIIHIEKEKFIDYCNELSLKRFIVLQDDIVYHYKLFRAEENIAKSVKKYINRKINKDRLDMHFDHMIQIIQEEDSIEYSKEQLEAIYEALSNGLFIITGGPGTGKTTILHAIIKMLKMLYGEDGIISLCAPTGRASKRMAYLSNNYACTIHRLLKWDLHSNSFAFNENNQLKTDVIIIDEFSMVDTLLFDSLLRGVKEVSQIILIGDDAQIPSVGAGNLLYDFLKVQKIKHKTLNFIYRQKDGSNIVNLANDIRHKQLNENFDFKSDVRFLSLNNYAAASTVIKILEGAFQQGYTFDNFQIIIPMYGTIAGIDNINATVQQWYNPASKTKNEIRVGHQIIREGDRVLQLKNQPEDDIFNGDIGIVISIDHEEEEMIVQFDVGEVVFSKQLFINLTLAYAISIHKSQGSEFDFVIMCVFKDYGFMLNKQLIYTAITRAKKQLFILGDFHTFMYKSMVENQKTRNTGLVEKILSNIS